MRFSDGVVVPFNGAGVYYETNSSALAVVPSSLGVLSATAAGSYEVS